DDNPAPASDIAEAADTSVQNARYHLEHLCEADLVETVDTWYSKKGTEMTVYALSVEELVIQLRR
ncbi:ArsR family transcriptional regulator, partial [Halobellus sp. Atlit-38R]|uniref:ArsR/SmtB family transcription factor n=2 Tax=Haloferacaceae TaxID=1644056 RepID=UPI000F2298CB